MEAVANVCAKNDIQALKRSQGLIEASLLAVKLTSHVVGMSVYGIFLGWRLVRGLRLYLKEYPLDACLSYSSASQRTVADLEHSLADKFLPEALKALHHPLQIRISFLHERVCKELFELQHEFEERAMYLDMACDTDESLGNMCMSGLMTGMPDEKEDAEWL